MSKFKKAFTSRFPEGRIVEVDWSQLEICVLQIESQDPVLAKEINDGLDLHTALTAVIYGHRYGDVKRAIDAHDKEWTARRRDTKRARFALQYGAGRNRIAHLTGWSQSKAKAFIDQYYLHYPMIEVWQQQVEAEVYATKGAWVEDGVDMGYKGYYTGPNGRRYVFTTYLNDRGEHKFSPTQLKNYPVQGLASDFVQVMANELHAAIGLGNYYDKVLLVNTIHDSVILDITKEVNISGTIDMLVKKVYGNAESVMTSLCQGKRPVNIPLRYSISSGYSWDK